MSNNSDIMNLDLKVAKSSVVAGHSSALDVINDALKIAGIVKESKSNAVSQQALAAMLDKAGQIGQDFKRMLDDPSKLTVAMNSETAAAKLAAKNERGAHS